MEYLKKKKSVHFELDHGNPIQCGLTCRETTAKITNSGDENAHNVYVKLDIYNSIGEIVYSAQKFLGDIRAGQSKTEIVTINADCGSFPFYGKCLTHMPLTLKSKVISDEATFPFPDQQFSE